VCLAAVAGLALPHQLMIRPILKYGDSTLHGKALPVDAVTAEIERLIDDMIETMYAAPGVGLAATQVGVPLRIFVVDISVGRDPNGLITMVNPEFVERDGVQLEEEGCLSVPGFNATVMRPMRAVVKGLDRQGEPHQQEGTGLLARAFQHEMDHLDGSLFVDRLRGIKRDLIVRKIQKLTRAGKW
jgi:peptide deformylase